MDKIQRYEIKYPESSEPNVHYTEKYWYKSGDVEKIIQLNAEMLELLKICNNYMKEKGISHEYAIIKKIKSIIEKAESIK